jgi:LAO/AO transport system kinase
MSSPDPAALFASARQGNRPAIGKLLTIVERGGAAARVIEKLAHELVGGAHTVGITGAPGAGKSTLTGGLLAVWRARDRRPAVLAVDPSSPFTGGAILGDRLRMQEHATDPEVFIRSLASRGHLGGLSLATPAAIRLLDALGWSPVVVETVGVGQVELEIATKADTTVVVVNPGWGDGVQANKAGLMEIADIFVINKSDRSGSAETRRDLEQMLNMSQPHQDETAAGESWRPPIVSTVATTGAGIAALADAIDQHDAYLSGSGVGEQRRQRRVREELTAIVARQLEQLLIGEFGTDKFADLMADVIAGRVDPWTAAETVTAGFTTGRFGAQRNQ